MPYTHVHWKLLQDQVTDIMTRHLYLLPKSRMRWATL